MKAKDHSPTYIPNEGWHFNGVDQYEDTIFMSGSTEIIDGAVVHTTYIDGKLTLKTFGPNPVIRICMQNVDGKPVQIECEEL